MMFKNEKDRQLIFTLHPALLMIFFDLNWYAKKTYNIDLTVTATASTLEEDLALNRVSTAHRDKIAIDIRTKGLGVFIIEDLINYVNSKPEYEEYQYLSFSGISRLAYFHIGSEEHIHLAIHSKFAIK